MKLFFVDTETTGIDPFRHAVVQIAGLIEVAGVEKERFDFRVRPMPGDAIDEEALRVNGLRREEVLKFPPPREVHRQVTVLLQKYVDQYKRNDKFFFIGYNTRFDSDFLRRFFEKAGDKYFGSWFWAPPIDVMTLAAFVLAPERDRLPNFKLPTVAEYLGLKATGSLHDAQVDIELTRQLYDVLRGRLARAAAR